MHPQILSEEQHRLLPFIQSQKKEFYLVGGTAIALQIGHRRSIDFDLFKKTNIRRDKIAKALHEHGHSFQLIFADSEGFHVIADGVKLTFFQFPFDIPAKKTFLEIRMPDLLHLAAMKAYALGRRSKWKDYVDLYFLLRDHFSLEQVSQTTESRFPGLFSAKLFRQQLCYFDDIDYTEEVTFLPGFEVAEAEIKAFLSNISTLAI
jgi:hypothetical protein